MKKYQRVGASLAMLSLVVIGPLGAVAATYHNDIGITRSDITNATTFTEYLPNVPYGMFGLFGIDGSGTATDGISSAYGKAVTMFLGEGFKANVLTPSSTELVLEDVPMSAIDGLTEGLAGKSSENHTHLIEQVEGLTEILEEGIQYETHSHYIEDTIGLEEALENKSDENHIHLTEQIEDIDTFFDAKADISSLSTVATSGAYGDLTGKPSLFSGSYTDLTNKPTLFSGAYNDLTGKPTLSSVATSGSYNDLTDKPTIGKAVDGTTIRTGTFPVYKNVTVSGGNAVFHITSDGTSGGSALCPTGPIGDSLQLQPEEGSAPHAFGAPVWSNSNKTVTIPATKIASVLGILTLSQSANGTPVRMSVQCY